MKRNNGGRPTSSDQLAILERRKRVSAAYLRGRTQWEIAQQEGVGQSTVSKDLAAIRKEWLAAALTDFNDRKAQELAKIDEMEAEAWEAWEASKSARQVATREKTSGGEAGERLKAGVRKEQREGNVEYLKVVQWCVNKRCEILGLDAPKKLRHGGDEDAPPIKTAATVTAMARVELLSRLSTDELKVLRDLRDRLAEPAGGGGGGEEGPAVEGDGTGPPPG